MTDPIQAFFHTSQADQWLRYTIEIPVYGLMVAFILKFIDNVENDRIFDRKKPLPCVRCGKRDSPAHRMICRK
jgi:hypothetical protein